MQYIQIKNSGLMEPQALTLVGASTKTGDSSKIGQFGSGNKYALAYLLRNKISLKVFSGLKEIKISVRNQTFRDQTFGVIHVNKKPTSITTEMGKDWELWQAIREIYCNAIDEGDSNFEIVDEIVPDEMETHFYIKVNKLLKDFMENFDNYFSVKKEVLFECEAGQILKKSGHDINIYRKGIKCSNYTSKSMFDYNLTQVRIDENRLISWSWEPEEKIWDLIFKCTNKDVLTKIFQGLTGNYYESSFSGVSDISSRNMSAECKEILTSMKIVPTEYSGLLKPDETHQFVRMPSKIFDQVKPILKNENMADGFKVYSEGHYREVDATDLQNGTIENALEFLSKAGFHVPYVIKVGIFADKDTLGCADGEVIVISEVNLEKGITEVINTIIEEFIHIKYGVSDESRGFQTAIITEFITYMKGNVSEGES